MLTKLINRLFLLIFLVVAAVALLYVHAKQSVERVANLFMYGSLESLPVNQTAMVLGATVYTDKRPSEVLARRLDTAISLYKQGKVSQLLMSGDGRSPDYNEVEGMQLYAEAAGVPSTAILLDPQGLRTYDSCYRASSVFHLTSLTVVTQPEHLKRAIYTCRSLGVGAIGYQGVTLGTGDLSFQVREQMALVLAWLDIHFLHPQPGDKH